MKRILLLTTVLTLLFLPAFAQKNGTSTKVDKAQMIRSILEDGRIYKRFLFSNEERPVVYLSSENISRDIVPARIGETLLTLKSPQEIEKEKSSLDVYCAFGIFEIKKSTAAVSFYYFTKDSTREGFDREVLEYEFRKVAGKWKFISRKHPGVVFG